MPGACGVTGTPPGPPLPHVGHFPLAPSGPVPSSVAASAGLEPAVSSVSSIPGAGGGRGGRGRFPLQPESAPGQHQSCTRPVGWCDRLAPLLPGSGGTGDHLGSLVGCRTAACGVRVSGAQLGALLCRGVACGGAAGPHPLLRGRSPNPICGAETPGPPPPLSQWLCSLSCTLRLGWGLQGGLGVQLEL